MARPTKLNEELLEKARGYLDTCTEDVVTDDGGRLSYMDVKLPSIVGLALHCDLDDETVSIWEAKGKVAPSGEASVEEVGEYELFKAFSAISTRVRQVQEQRLMDGGIGRKYDPKLASLILGHKHNYRDKQDITSNGEAINVTVVKYKDDDQKDG